ncbi:MAG TPA: hypothetical protein VK914_06255 [bacterium]|jgi:hypothetical protein|nr:hypothetical protein [bacterium]
MSEDLVGKDGSKTMLPFRASPLLRKTIINAFFLTFSLYLFEVWLHKNRIVYPYGFAIGALIGSTLFQRNAFIEIDSKGISVGNGFGHVKNIHWEEMQSVRGLERAHKWWAWGWRIKLKSDSTTIRFSVHQYSETALQKLDAFLAEYAHLAQIK